MSKTVNVFFPIKTVMNFVICSTKKRSARGNGTLPNSIRKYRMNDKSIDGFDC